MSTISVTRYWIGVGAAFTLGAIVASNVVNRRTAKVVNDVVTDVSELVEQIAAKRTAGEERVKSREIYNGILGDQEYKQPKEVLVEEIEGEWEDIDTQTIICEIEEDPAQKEPIIETDFETFVAGTPNTYGISYIEEEEYFEEDGRYKGQVEVILGDMEPLFLLNGNPIDDWEERIGGSILVDFYKLVPPGLDPILYVRNNHTDEDYEVIRTVA